VSVQVIGDTLLELDEVFNVRLTNAVNATIARGQGQGAIRNDDSQSVFPARIIVQPQSQDVFVGANVIFTVQATGSQPLIYQWSFNGVTIPGTTTDTLTISQAQLTDAGNYTVVVSNAIGSDTSLPAILTVSNWKFATGSWIRSSPAIALDGTVYFGSADTKLYALNPDGSKQWDFTTGDDVYSSPAIGADGAIYFGSYDNKLYALNTNGTKRWEFTTAGVIFSSPTIGTIMSVWASGR